MSELMMDAPYRPAALERADYRTPSVRRRLFERELR